MPKFQFTLTLADITEITPQGVEALYDAGCNDAKVVSKDGSVELDFARQALGISAAIRSAIRDIRKAGFEVLADDD